MAKVISIVSGKGGVGKTTLAVNLGAALASQFRRNVTLMDCNVTTSHLGMHLGMYQSPRTLNHVLRGESSIEETMYKHFTGMNVVPSSISIHELNGVDITKLKDVVDNITHKNDVVLLDASPGLGREAISAMKACNEIIYVTNPHVPSVIDVIRCQEIANEIGKTPIGVILNMVNKESHMEKNDVERLTDLPVISSIPYDKNILRSLDMKQPVVMTHPKSRASEEIMKLASSLVGEKYEPRRFLSRYFSFLRF